MRARSLPLGAWMLVTSLAVPPPSTREYASWDEYDRDARHTRADGGLVMPLVRDAPTIIERGLWHGFDRRASVAVASSALGGLIVSAVLKYADSVLKGYATSASVILTGLLSALLFGTAIDLHFMLAVVNVTCSIALYGNLASQRPPAPVTPALAWFAKRPLIRAASATAAAFFAAGAGAGGAVAARFANSPLIFLAAAAATFSLGSGAAGGLRTALSK